MHCAVAITSLADERITAWGLSFCCKYLSQLPLRAKLFYAKKAFDQKGQKSEDTSLFRTLLPLDA